MPTQAELDGFSVHIRRPGVAGWICVHTGPGILEAMARGKNLLGVKGTAVGISFWCNGKRYLAPVNKVVQVLAKMDAPRAETNMGRHPALTGNLPNDQKLRLPMVGGLDQFKAQPNGVQP